jgi:hypothetical protein
MTDDRLHYQSPEEEQWKKDLDRDLNRLRYLQNLEKQGKLDLLLVLELENLENQFFPPPRNPAPPPRELRLWNK